MFKANLSHVRLYLKTNTTKAGMLGLMSSSVVKYLSRLHGPLEFDSQHHKKKITRTHTHMHGNRKKMANFLINAKKQARIPRLTRNSKCAFM